jgi:hypothetical protein
VLLQAVPTDSENGDLSISVFQTSYKQNNGNTKKLKNNICVGYIERTSVGNTECSSVYLYSVVHVSVH